jgi:serine protease Do
MTVKKWLEQQKVNGTRRVFASVLAFALVFSFASYEFAARARAATPAPPAAALDDNSVSPLLSLDKAMENLAARVTPATVNVTVTSKHNAQVASFEGQDDQEGDDDSNGQAQQFGPFGFGFGQQMRPHSQIEHGLGSGVIISPDGYIVTNNHVIDGAMDIHVTMSDKRILPAKLVGADPLTDLAVIKVNASDLPSVPLGDSTALKPGQTVLAFGNPLGFRFTVTRGIVSALNRPNPYAKDRRSPGEFIQTDAAINPGNSGGPLVNAHGEVVGINTFLISETGGFSGMGFAIPSQIVKPTVDSLIKYGKVSHGYMGIGISDVTPDEAKFFNVQNASGAVVTQVEPNSPGAKAGLKVGDVITELNGKNVADSGALQAEVVQQQPGTKLNLKVMRDGKPMNTAVTLEEVNKNERGSERADASNGKPRWGVGLADLSPDVRQQLQVNDSVKGAVVAKVTPGSPADNAGLQQGDIITEVNRKPVQSAGDASSALKNVGSGQDALVLVYSHGGSSFRVLHGNQG